MFKNFVEIEQFGLNWLTLIFLITLIFTILQAISLTIQSRAIYKNESGKTVSFVFYSSYGFSAIAVIIYGISKNSLALTINGFIGFIVLSILVNILRYKKVSFKEKFVGLLAMLAIPLSIMVENKDLLFFFFGVFVQMSLVIQIIELVKNKQVGSLKPHQAIVSIFSSSFWFTYSLIMNIWPIIAINLSGISLWIITLALYFKYKKYSHAIA